MNNIELQAVCWGIKNGNESDFKALFHAYYPRLLFYACRFVDKETGEDVVQDVFMHVWENRERLVMDEAFVSFLYESIYNKVLNILKHEQVKTEKHAEMEVRQRALHYFSPYDNPIFDSIIHHEQYDELKAAIDKLPEKGKLCIRMSYLQGLKTKEIAKILQIYLRTVETHLYTSLRMLRKMFDEEDKMLLLAACSFFSLIW